MDLAQVLIAIIGLGAALVSFCLMRFPQYRRHLFRQLWGIFIRCFSARRSRHSCLVYINDPGARCLAVSLDQSKMERCRPAAPHAHGL